MLNKQLKFIIYFSIIVTPSIYTDKHPQETPFKYFATCDAVQTVIIMIRITATIIINIYLNRNPPILFLSNSLSGKKQMAL